MTNAMSILYRQTWKRIPCVVPFSDREEYLMLLKFLTNASSTMKKLTGKTLQAIIKQVYQYCFIYML